MNTRAWFSCIRRSAAAGSNPAMIVVHQVGATFLMVTVTLWLQAAGIASLLAWVSQATEGYIQKLGPFRVAALFVRVTAAIITLHALEILLWASCYRWLCFPSWESATYFSASSYGTVGYGDVVLPKTWRMLGPLESIVGVLMCGFSVSVLFAIATRLAGRER